MSPAREVGSKRGLPRQGDGDGHRTARVEAGGRRRVSRAGRVFNGCPGDHHDYDPVGDDHDDGGFHVGRADDNHDRHDTSVYYDQHDCFHADIYDGSVHHDHADATGDSHLRVQQDLLCRWSSDRSRVGRGVR